MTIKQLNYQCDLLQSDKSVSQYCVTVSQYCVTIKQLNYQCDLLQSDKSVNTVWQSNSWTISAICYNQTSQSVNTVWQLNVSVRSVTLRQVIESALCDNQTDLRPRPYSRPAMRYRLHFHVNTVQLKTYAIKKSRFLTLSLSLKQILTSAITNLKTPRTALCGTYKWRLYEENYCWWLKSLQLTFAFFCVGGRPLSLVCEG